RLSDGNISSSCPVLGGRKEIPMSSLRWLTASAVLLLGCAHQNAATRQAAASPAPSGSAYGAPASSTSEAAPAATCDAIRVHFAFDSAAIEESERAMLARAGDCLEADAKLHVVIEGNADERGTVEYNIALGQRRADAVSSYLERLGVTPLQLRTISYGKERPLCTDHNEACWAQNRRAAVKPQLR